MKCSSLFFSLFFFTFLRTSPFDLVFATLWIMNHSLVFLFVRVLIHPGLTFTPNLVVDDLFNLMSWKMCPIRFRHLSCIRGFACSITAPPLLSLLELLLQLDILSQCLSDTFGTVPAAPFSHEATPLFSNFIDIKESTKSYKLELIYIQKEEKKKRGKGKLEK